MTRKSQDREAIHARSVPLWASARWHWICSG